MKNKLIFPLGKHRYIQDVLQNEKIIHIISQCHILTNIWDTLCIKIIVYSNINC